MRVVWGVLAAVLLLGACDPQLAKDARRERENAAKSCVFVAAALGAGWAVRCGRRRRAEGDPGSGVVAGAMAARVAGSYLLLLAGVALSYVVVSILSPRELFTNEPLDSPDWDLVMAIGIVAGGIAAALTAVGLALIRFGARVLHRFGNVELQEAIAAVAALGLVWFQITT